MNRVRILELEKRGFEFTPKDNSDKEPNHLNTNHLDITHLPSKKSFRTNPEPSIPTKRTNLQSRIPANLQSRIPGNLQPMIQPDVLSGIEVFNGFVSKARLLYS